MLGKRFVKILSIFEIELFCHCLVVFGFQKNLVDC
jgi:hypothetical protein